MQGNLYLIGFMGAGKTAVARYLETYEHMEMAEMDQEIVRQTQKTITRIFEEDGEAYFRQLETALLMRLAQKKGIVVSCGGGVIKKQENLELMKKSGTVVWLQADPFTIYKRVRRDNSRPLLAGRMDPDSIRAMMEERRPLYESAADVCVTVDGRSVAAIGQEILRKVSGRASVCESPQ